jgi:LysM repeat protein
MSKVHTYVQNFVGPTNRKVVNLVHLTVAASLFCALGISMSVFTTQAQAAPSCTQPYVVKPGDTLSIIAMRYGANWRNLAQANGIPNPNLIYVDQHICITKTRAATTKSVAPPIQSAAPTTTSVAPVAPIPTSTPAPIQAQPTTPGVNNVASTDVNGLIDAIFGSYAAGARNVAMCESGMNPDATNPSSNAAGVFQILYPSTWDTTPEAGQSPYNAQANITAAHEIFVRDGYSWREWTCEP